MLQHIYNYQLCYKGKKNKKDPLTKHMLQHMMEQAAKYLMHCLHQAIIDWHIQPLSKGYRCIKWCKEHNPRDKGFKVYNQLVEHTTKMIYAKYAENWQFFDWNKRIINNPLNIDLANIAASSNIYCFQKGLCKHCITICHKSTPEAPS